MKISIILNRVKFLMKHLRNYIAYSGFPRNVNHVGQRLFLENGTFESCTCRSNVFSVIFYATMK